jgi:hypothetical protein
VQRQLCAGLITVDETGIGLEICKTSPLSCAHGQLIGAGSHDKFRECLEPGDDARQISRHLLARDALLQPCIRGLCSTRTNSPPVKSSSGADSRSIRPLGIGLADPGPKSPDHPRAKSRKRPFLRRRPGSSSANTHRRRNGSVRSARFFGNSSNNRCPGLLSPQSLIQQEASWRSQVLKASDNLLIRVNQKGIPGRRQDRRYCQCCTCGQIRIFGETTAEDFRFSLENKLTGQVHVNSMNNVLRPSLCSKPESNVVEL